MLGYVYDALEKKTQVLSLDAKDIGSEPVAVIQLPVFLPVGLHGTWSD